MIANFADPIRNMYGSTPCPKCQEPYRYRMASEPGVLQCDDCGFKEPATPGNSDIERDK